MRATSVVVPEKYLELLEELVRAGFYENRSAAIRVAIRDLLIKHGLMRLKGET